MLATGPDRAAAFTGGTAWFEVVWRHLPLNAVHFHAQLAAEASEAAALGA